MDDAAESIEGERGGDDEQPTPPVKRGRRLGNLQNVRGALADVIRGLEAETLDVSRARCMVYALSTLASVISGTEVEERLALVEAQIEGRHQ